MHGESIFLRPRRNCEIHFNMYCQWVKSNSLESVPYPCIVGSLQTPQLSSQPHNVPLSLPPLLPLCLPRSWPDFEQLDQRCSKYCRLRGIIPCSGRRRHNKHVEPRADACIEQQRAIRVAIRRVHAPRNHTRQRRRKSNGIRMAYK